MLEGGSVQGTTAAGPNVEVERTLHSSFLSNMRSLLRLYRNRAAKAARRAICSSSFSKQPEPLLANTRPYTTSF